MQSFLRAAMGACNARRATASDVLFSLSLAPRCNRRSVSANESLSHWIHPCAARPRQKLPPPGDVWTSTSLPNLKLPPEPQSTARPLHHHVSAVRSLFILFRRRQVSHGVAIVSPLLSLPLLDAPHHPTSIMSWPLADLEKEAGDVASGLQIFLDEAPSSARDISACITQLLGISTAVCELETNLDYAPQARSSRRFLSDIDTVVSSLRYTLQDVRDMFGRTGDTSYLPGTYPDARIYGILWDDLNREMRHAGMSLITRLVECHTFLKNLNSSLESRRFSSRDTDGIRVRLQQLLRQQEPLEARMGRLGLDTDPPPVPHAPVRPPFTHYDSFPRYTTQPQPAGRPFFTHRYSSPPYVPPAYIPPAPEVPLSPTSSSSSGHTGYFSGNTYYTSNTSSSSQPVHWAMSVFDGHNPVSPLHRHGDFTRCLGRNDPNALKMLQSDGFMKVLELPFETTDVLIRLYWKPSDHRVRILFLTMEAGIRYRYCMPLTSLKILRTESTLQLCRVNQADGKLDLWANLKFTCYERMVLFFCTAVAMKRQDWVQSPQGLQDFFQPGEEEEFGGEIEDDHYLHEFRIFRDKDSGGVRFEASARRGPMRQCPIWTAFVTSYIGSRSWMKRVSANIVQLRDLKPYIFCSNYTPRRGATGKFELKFTTVEGTDSKLN